MIKIWDGQLEVGHLISGWISECSGAKFSICKCLSDLHSMREGENSDVLLLVQKSMVVGAMGIAVSDIFYTEDNYAVIRYWGIEKPFRMLADDFIRHAKSWAAKHGCTKLLACSSKLSIPCDDFYKKVGFAEFETVYIGDV